MTLRLYNTLTRRKEDFRPLDADNVRVYVCGPTVYDFAHIGNARPVVVFDVLFRLLRHVYGADHVTYVRNITDVDDKINARAARDYPDLPLNEAIGRVTEGTLRQFHADVAALGCLEPTVEPRATGHIDDMKAMIERLVEKNCAYVAEDHVLFHVAAMPDYGVLANRSLDEMLAGARVEVAPYKRDAMDFVLWKPSSPGEPAWESPCGIETPGRPGWHIECSAMAWQASGRDLRHPRRRHRPDVPAPRERAGSEPLRAGGRAHGERVDAQRLPAGRGPQDGQERGQFRHYQRSALDFCIWRAALERRGSSLRNASNTLPTAPRLDRIASLRVTPHGSQPRGRGGVR
jgi:hypothetical protein